MKHWEYMQVWREGVHMFIYIPSDTSYESLNYLNKIDGIVIKHNPSKGRIEITRKANACWAADILDAFGLQGWEAVNFSRRGAPYYAYLFKRPLPDKPGS